jgi:hypothetical protein
MTDEITATVGRHLYSFDGRVLEVFGGHTVRFHVRHMHIRAKELDRKGKRATVDICHGRPGAAGARHIWTYSVAKDGDLSGLFRLLDTVAAAIDSAAGQ